MRKSFIIAAITVISMAFPASAQLSKLANLNIFNHVGADLGVGTTGVSFELATPITNWVQLRAGFSVMPNVKFKSEYEANVETFTAPGASSYVDQDIDVNLTAGLGRTQGQIIFNAYPFGARNNFFLAVGAYFGGKSLISVKGQSDQVAAYQEQGILKTGYVEVGKNKINFEEGGVIRGGVYGQSFRPYLGLGYGRPCLKGRVGFMFELGCQFMGKLKLGQGKNLDPVDLSGVDEGGAIQTIMDKITVYPVLRLCITGRFI